uniref:VWFD domain-containing protein n=1 Tax=Panagrellus redivivus TaxID=6233 RepID=A0A7E4VTZ4_PANRE
MLKTKTRLTAGIIETGCKFRAYLEDWSKLVVVQCCCDGHDDPNCAEVTSAVKEKKILCFDGTLTPNARFYFAKECHYTVTKHYKRIFPKNSHEKMKKSKLYHLYTSNIGQVEYDVSFAFLVEKNVESSCYEKTHQFDRDYYVINCATRSCDRSFQSGFVDLLDEKALSEAVLKAQVPHCENGSISIVAEDAALDKLPHLPNTTPVVGQFCMTRLKMGLHGSNKVIDINFGPIHRIDQDCNTHFVKADGEFQYKCCYEASSDLLHIEPNCHYSTILSVINSPDNDEEVKNEDEAIPDPTEADQIPTRQTVFENVDKCEQSNTGQLGKLSRRCQPGGHGCFHQKGLTDANEAVIASCIGGAEKLIAAHQNAFDRFHEALICLVEEAQNQCHVVESGTRREFLCCCGATVIRNHVASCVVDSNMLFNTKEYAVKYVGEFKDVD